MPGMKQQNVKQSHGYYKRQTFNENSDEEEWTPDKQIRRNISPLNEKVSSQRVSSLESGGESDGVKANDCPLCLKSFSRSAALICHVKQNHRYMLSKKLGDDATAQSMKDEVMEWKKRLIKKKNSKSYETSFSAGSSGTDKDSGNEVCAGSNINANNDDEGDIDVVSEDFSIIGGSANSIGGQCVEASSAKSSILAFNCSNADLLDPDQRFSIIRQNSRKNVKQKKRQQQRSKVSSSANTVSHKSSESKAALDFASVDLSIDNSSEDQKTFECFVCKNRFSSSSLLTYHHMRKHMTNDFRQCLVCGSVFYDLALFTSHCNLHSKSTTVKRCNRQY